MAINDGYTGIVECDKDCENCAYSDFETGKCTMEKPNW
jgi:hypothetical protein